MTPWVVSKVEYSDIFYGLFRQVDRHMRRYQRLKPVDRRPRNLYLEGMEMVPLKPERKAQLDEYARRHGQDLAAALDDVLAAYFDEEQDYAETVQAVQEAYEDVKAGRAPPPPSFWKVYA